MVTLTLLILVGTATFSNMTTSWSRLGAITCLSAAILQSISGPETTTLFAGNLARSRPSSILLVLLYLVSSVVLLLETGLRDRVLLMLLSVLGGIRVLLGENWVVFYLGLELQSFALYALAGLYKKSQGAVLAGTTYFFLGAFSSAMILLGISGSYIETGLLTKDRALHTPLYVGLIAAGLLFKVAAAPFHRWSPDVYDGVPTPVTTWLTLAPKLSLLLVLRQLPISLLLFACRSMMLGAIQARTQGRVKRVRAYSATANVGYILVLMPQVELLVRYLVQYALVNTTIFAVLHAYNVTTRAQVKGLLRQAPLAGAAITIALLSLAGIPPIAGFYAKLLVLSTANGWASRILVVASVISTGYYLRIVSYIAFYSSSSTSTRRPITTAHILAVLTLVTVGLWIPGW